MSRQAGGSNGVGVVETLSNGKGPARQVLVLADAYVPGWKAGGPIRSLENLVNAFAGAVEFRIITRDRDHGDSAPYGAISADVWQEVGNASVFYASPGSVGFVRLRQLIDEAQPDVVLCYGVFSRVTIRLLVLRRWDWTLEVPVVVAPQGQLSPEALAIKRYRKWGYLLLAKRTSLLRGVTWLASNGGEALQVQESFPDASVSIVSDIPDRPPPRPIRGLPKTPGEVRLCFMSRVAPIKNPAFLIRALAGVRGRVRLSVFGPREGGAWEEVESLLPTLDSGKEVHYEGIVRPNQRSNALAKCHFFVLPSLGENFGHAVFEALSAGRPVLVSDRTPWKDLDSKEAGWSIPLEDPGAWSVALQYCVDMEEAEYSGMVQAAHSFARQWSDTDSDRLRFLDLIAGL